MLTGLAELAEEHLRKLLESEPDFVVRPFLLGEAYSQLGRHEEGIALLVQAERSAHLSFLPLGFLAWAYVRGGRTQSGFSPD